MIAFLKTEKKFLRFLVNLVFLFLIVFLFDRAGGAILKHLYFSQTSGLGYRTTYSIDSTNADILVFGSSRANHHYVPEVFEDGLKMSFYNTGRDGNFLLYNYAIFKAILTRHTPKIIIMDINPDELCFNQESYDRLSSLLPYYKNHPEIRDIVELRSPFEKYKLYSAIYPFNSGLLTIGVGNMEFNKLRKGDRKGYVPLFNQMKDTVLVAIEREINYTIDSTKVEIIKQIAIDCKAKDIKLYFVQSPVFVNYDQNNSNKLLVKIISSNNYKIIDFSSDSLFLKNPIFFQDQMHLNDEGAIIFSKFLANRIKERDLIECKINSIPSF